MLDDGSLWLEEPLLKTKDEAFPAFVTYETRALTQHGIRFKCLHSDRGGKFLFTAMIDYLAQQGIERKLTVHNTPEHNGAAEQTHQTIFEMVRALLMQSGLPKWLWGYAHQYAVYLYNSTPRRTLNFKSPYKARFGSLPNLSNACVFGCICYVKDNSGDKLSVRVAECCWLGPDVTSNGFWVYWPDKHKMSLERNIVYSTRENLPIKGEYEDLTLPQVDGQIPTPVAQAPGIEPSPEIPSDGTEPVDQDIQTGRHIRHPSAKIRDIMKGKAVTGDEVDEPASIIEANMVSAISDVALLDPRTVTEAQKRPNWLSIHNAMKDEIWRLEARDSWEYSDLPPKGNLIGLKWVFQTKCDENGNKTGQHARVVARGDTQKNRIDYHADDTFAPVAKMTLIRSILVLAVRHSYTIHQMDVKSAYLYGRLEPGKEIYLKPPQSVELNRIKPGMSRLASFSLSFSSIFPYLFLPLSFSWPDALMC